MAMDNTTAFVGNLTRDPELRYTGGGKALARFSIAVNQKGFNGAEDKTHFIDCTAFGTLAEGLADSCRKGDRVAVQGTLEYATWETEQGEKRSKLAVLANDVAVSLRFATATIAKQQDGGGARAAAPAPAAPAAQAADPGEAPF